MSLSSQAILIVGGGQGIGFETTKAILETCPASKKVIILGLHADTELGPLSEKHSGRIDIILGDVTKPSDRSKAVETCIKRLGGIDTLVYCAGVITPIERTERVNIEDVKNTFDVNVFSAMAMSQLCLPYLRKSASANPTNAGCGKIILLSSACDFTVTYHGWMAYCTSKAALSRFVHLLAHEEPTLCVQGVFPKLTRTKMAPSDIIRGKYNGIMADHEIERFKMWDEMGDEFVQPPRWVGEAVAKLAAGMSAGGLSGSVMNYDEHVQDLRLSRL